MAPQIVAEIIAGARQEQRRSLLEPEAEEICRAYGMPILDFAVAHQPFEAADIANRIGYPVVLKVVSPEILHKTEAGGVLLDLNSGEEASQGFSRILEKARSYNKKARILGVLVQHMAPKGVEVIVGGLRDSQFGPTVLFGLGGIFVEVLRDASFRVAPVSEFDSTEMIKEIHGHSILQGVRGQPPADEMALRKIIQATSNIMVENGAIQQMDLNPVIAYPNGATVVDARMILTD